MCFHSNQLLLETYHKSITKFTHLALLVFAIMLAPVISSLDGIYCSVANLEIECRKQCKVNTLSIVADSQSNKFDARTYRKRVVAATIQI